MGMKEKQELEAWPWWHECTKVLRMIQHPYQLCKEPECRDSWFFWGYSICHTYTAQAFVRQKQLQIISEGNKQLCFDTDLLTGKGSGQMRSASLTLSAPVTAVF